MGTLLIFAGSNALTMLLTAWLLHRHSTGQSPIPKILPRALQNDDDEPTETEPVYQRGRPVL